MADLCSPLIDLLISLALTEDLAHGDITSSLAVEEGHESVARIIARQRLTVCGLPLLTRIARAAHAPVAVDVLVKEGTEVEADTVIAEAGGSTRRLLSLERVWLNFLQRLSGVATHVRDSVDQSRGVTLLDTRKTLPGWRVLEKYAVFTGGARNHRMSLGDLILIKNNHLDANQVKTPDDALRFFEKIRAGKPFHIPIECEVRTIEELRLVLLGRPNLILLDNMNDDELEICMNEISRADPRPIVEVSGGVTVERLKILSAFGVEFASLGSLTTKATNVDISMRLTPSSLMG